MFRLLSFNAAGTERCFITFLQSVLATYGDGAVPDFNLLPHDPRGKGDPQRLCVKITTDRVTLQRPLLTQDDQHTATIQALELPQLLSEPSTVVGLCDDLLGLMNRLYEGYETIERHSHLPGSDGHPSRMAIEEIDYLTMRTHLQHFLEEVHTGGAESLEILFKDTGGIIFYHTLSKPADRLCRERWHFR